MITLTWTLVAFLSGSLPFSVWVGRIASQTDIRQYGDHNPGATNVARASGWQWGLLALILDITKGALPVGLAWYWLELSGFALAVVAVAPILGHAYSPFLKFRGGKAIAVSLGIWIGLTSGVAVIYIIPPFLFWYLIIGDDGWVVILTLLTFLIYLLLFNPSPSLFLVWTANLLIMAWKHRQKLAQLPVARSWPNQVL